MKNKNEFLEKRLTFFTATPDMPQSDIQTEVKNELDKKDGDADSLRDRYKKGEIKGEDLIKAATEVADRLIANSKAEGVKKAEVLRDTLQAFARELKILMPSETEKKIESAYEVYEEAVDDAYDLFEERTQDYTERIEGSRVTFGNFDNDIENAPNSSKTKKAYDAYQQARSELRTLQNQKRNMGAVAQVLKGGDIEAQITQAEQKVEETKTALEEAIKADYQAVYTDGGEFKKQFSEFFDRGISLQKQKNERVRLSEQRNEDLTSLNNEFIAKLPTDFSFPIKLGEMPRFDAVINQLTRSVGTENFDSLSQYLTNANQDTPFRTFDELKAQLKNEELKNTSAQSQEAIVTAFNNAIYLKNALAYKVKYNEIPKRNVAYYAARNVAPAPAATDADGIASVAQAVVDATGVVQAEVAAPVETGTAPADVEVEVVAEEDAPASAGAVETADLADVTIDFSQLDKKGVTKNDYKKNGDQIAQALKISEGLDLASATNERGQQAVEKIQTALNEVGIKDAQGRDIVADGFAGPITIAALEEAMMAQDKKSAFLAQLGVSPTTTEVMHADTDQLRTSDTTSV